LPSYQNLLKVPPNDWLMAVLDGVYQDWNGIPLQKTNDKLDGQSSKTATAASTTSTTSTSNGNSASTDWGANHWKVTFIKLTIYLLGFPVFSKDFDQETSRVWRTTYMDNNNNDNNSDSSSIRIVRASQTGLLQDEVIFYTKRRPSPFV
jgi:hypothetical protein